MEFLYKVLNKNKNKREDAIIVTSILGIVINLIIASAKLFIGFLASSIAIMSEGANNASDAFTSVIALVGTKIAKKHPDKKHPFGYGRIEYLTSLVISTLIVVTGFEFLKSSIHNIIHPACLDVSYLSLIIIAASALIKLWLGTYTINTGKRVESNSLVAVGTECRSDSVASTVTIISSLAFLIFGFNIDGFAGVFTSCLIIKAGIEVLKDTVSDLLGKAGKEDLAKEIYKEVRACDIVINAVDMKLHNYGPDRYSGSCNIEIDKNKTIEEVYKKIHELQLRIMHEHNVVMVFGTYAVDYNSKDSIKMRKQIADFIKGYQHVISYHALYKSLKEKKIYVDLIVDYDLKDWDKLKEDFTSYMKKLYKNYELELTIETEFV